MRKMKKINGYLVVRFNDREKRLYESTGLGNYGVIDAELYTGRLELDRRDMKYDSVDTLEEAAELARSLEAEVDLSGEPATCAVIVETGDSYSERKVEPDRMVRNWEDELVKQIGSASCPDTDSRTASYALYGYTAALCDLGFLPEDRCSVDPGAFGRYDTPGNPDSSRESLRSYICDELCRHRSAGNTQEELAAICAECQIGRLSDGTTTLPASRSGTFFSRMSSGPPTKDNHSGNKPDKAEEVQDEVALPLPVSWHLGRGRQITHELIKALSAPHVSTYLQL